jgi:hypothetical protein
MKASVSTASNKIEKITTILEPTRWTYKHVIYKDGNKSVSIFAKNNKT